MADRTAEILKRIPSGQRKDEILRRIPAVDAAAAAATGGAGTGKPLRVEMNLSDEVIDRTARGGTPPMPKQSNNSWLGSMGDIAPTAKALMMAPAIGVGETAAFVGGALTPGVSIEDIRQRLKLPQLRAEQNLEAVPRVGRVLARGVEGAAGGLPIGGGLVKGAQYAKGAGYALNEAFDLMASNPTAILKAGAMIDAGASSAGEIAAQLAEGGGGTPDQQEWARAFTTLVTAVGAPRALNALKEMGLAIKDIAIPKPPARIQQEAGGELASLRLREPGVMDTARQNAAEFQQYGMQPPPIGSLTGNAALEAEQAAGMRDIPGMAQTERARQASVDASIRQQIVGAAPQGNVADVSSGIAQNIDTAEQQAIAARQQLADEIRDTAERQIQGQRGWDILRDAMGGDVDTVVRNMIADAEARATAALAPLGDGISARQAGEIFVKELEAARTQFRNLANSAFEEFLQGTDNITVETDSIRQAAARASLPSNPLTAAAEEAATPRIIRDIRENDDVLVMNPRQLQGLRSTILSALREAQGGATANPQNARKLNLVLEAIDDQFDLLETKIPGLDVLNNWYREGKTALHGGLVKDVGRDLKSRGGISIHPSELAARYLKTNTEAGADEVMEQFSRTWGGQNGVEPQGALTSGIAGRAPSQIAERAMDEYIIRQMRLYAQDQLTGVVNRGKLQDWVERHQVALERRPELNKKLRSVAEAQRLADNQIDQIKASRAEYDRLLKAASEDPANAATKLKLQSLERDLKDANKLVTEVGRKREALRLAIEDPQGRLNQIAAADPAKAGFEYRKLQRELAGDPLALAGLEAGMWDALTSRFINPETGKAGLSPLVDPDAFAKLLAEKGKLIKELFGDDRAELLQTMQRLSARNMASGKPRPSTGTPGKTNRIGDFMSSIVSRAWGIQRGVVGVPYVATEAALRVLFPGSKTAAINTVEAQRVLEKALYDPDFYEELVRLAKFPRNKRIARNVASIISGTRTGLGMAADNRALRTRQDLKANYERRAEGR